MYRPCGASLRSPQIYDNNNIWKIPDVSSMWGFAALAPTSVDAGASLGASLRELAAM